MKSFIGFLILVCICIINVVLGGLSISAAIEAFKEEKYTRFGIEVMISIMFITTIVLQAIEWRFGG